MRSGAFSIGSAWGIHAPLPERAPSKWTYLAGDPLVPLTESFQQTIVELRQLNTGTAVGD